MTLRDSNINQYYYLNVIFKLIVILQKNKPKMYLIFIKYILIT